MFEVVLNFVLKVVYEFLLLLVVCYEGVFVVVALLFLLLDFVINMG